MSAGCWLQFINEGENFRKQKYIYFSIIFAVFSNWSNLWKVHLKMFKILVLSWSYFLDKKVNKLKWIEWKTDYYLSKINESVSQIQLRCSCTSVSPSVSHYEQFWDIAPGAEPRRPLVSAELQSQRDGDGAAPGPRPPQEGYFLNLTIILLMVHYSCCNVSILYHRVPSVSSLFLIDGQQDQSGGDEVGVHSEWKQQRGYSQSV